MLAEPDEEFEVRRVCPIAKPARHLIVGIHFPTPTQVYISQRPGHSTILAEVKSSRGDPSRVRRGGEERWRDGLKTGRTPLLGSPQTLSQFASAALREIRAPERWIYAPHLVNSIAVFAKRATRSQGQRRTYARERRNDPNRPCDPHLKSTKEEMHDDRENHPNDAPPPALDEDTRERLGAILSKIPDLARSARVACWLYGIRDADPDDFVHNGMLKLLVWSGLTECLKDEAQLQHTLLAAARQATIDHARKRKLPPVPWPEDDCLADNRSGETEAEAEARDWFKRALPTLTGLQRQVITECYLNGRSLTDLAAERRCSVENVRMAGIRGLQRLGQLPPPEGL